MSRLRAGLIDYINPFPLFAGIEWGHITCELDWRRGVPTEINRALIEGSVDVALISVASYLEHADQLELLPSFGVAAEKTVGSVHLYTRYPPEELHGLSVGYTSQSASSVGLLRLLFREYWKVDVHMVPLSGELELQAGQQLPAFLLIGDQSFMHPEIHAYQTIDLVSVWDKLTNLPFVFATFAARKNVVSTRSDELNAFLQAIGESLCWSENHLDQIIVWAQKKLDCSQARLRSYFQGLRYRLGERELLGLEHFSKLYKPSDSVSRVETR